jgi:hypothetical protein
MRIIQILICALIVGSCTWVAGWWAVPAFAAIYAVVRRTNSAPADVAIGTLIAWSALLVIRLLQPGHSVLLARLGAIFPVPGFVVMIIAAMFAMMLAWSTARVVIGLSGVRSIAT